MNEPKYIKNWEELRKEKSNTHVLKMDTSGYCGWIEAKDENDKKNSLFIYTYFLRWHT